MSIQIDKIANDLFDKIRSRFEDVSLGNENAKATSKPEDARFFNFDYIQNGHNFGTITISLIDELSLKIYFSKNISDKLDDDQRKNWYDFLKDLRFFAKRSSLNFEPRDITRNTLKFRDVHQLSKDDDTYSRNELNLGESLYKAYNMTTPNKFAKQFENWANNIVESWEDDESTTSPEVVDSLIELLSSPLPVGIDAANATSALENIVNNDELTDALAELANENPEEDARNTILDWIENNDSELFNSIIAEVNSDDSETTPEEPGPEQPEQMAESDFDSDDEDLPDSFKEKRERAKSCDYDPDEELEEDTLIPPVGAPTRTNNDRKPNPQDANKSKEKQGGGKEFKDILNKQLTNEDVMRKLAGITKL